KDDNYKIVRNIVFDWTSAENWYHVLEGDKALIKLTPEESSFIIDNVKNQKFIDRLNIEIRKVGRPVFAKLEQCSTKQDFTPREIFNADDLINQFNRSGRCIQQLTLPYKKEHYILITRYNENIKPENEFRVFIDNKKISGISQQHLYDVYEY